MGRRCDGATTEMLVFVYKKAMRRPRMQCEHDFPYYTSWYHLCRSLVSSHVVVLGRKASLLSSRQASTAASVEVVDVARPVFIVGPPSPTPRRRTHSNLTTPPTAVSAREDIRSAHCPLAQLAARRAFISRNSLLSLPSTSVFPSLCQRNPPAATYPPCRSFLFRLTSSRRNGRSRRARVQRCAVILR